MSDDSSEPLDESGSHDEPESTDEAQAADEPESTDGPETTDSRSGEFGVATDAVTGATDAPTGATADSSGDATSDSSGDPAAEESGDAMAGDGDEARYRRGESDSASADADAPLQSLATSVEDRRSRDVDRPDDDLFSEESVPEIDADVVWERLEADDAPELPDDAERDVHVVEKRSYCEQCPFFSTPPDVGCNHDGTEILELVDMEHFRVVDCPKVRENEQLERL